MAPIRRYLRITKYSVLECRIYLDNPGLAQTWLLNPRNPVLPRVIESVRPLVLPKLREERERSRKRSTKKKGIKDVVVEDDFEVSIFLTETSTRHSLLTKHKHFHDTTQTRLTSNNSGRLIGATNEAPIDVDVAADLGVSPEAVPGLRREDSDEDAGVTLADLPAADDNAGAEASGRRPKRARRNTETTGADRGQEGDVVEVTSDDEQQDAEDDDELFVDGANESNTGPPPHKRRKGAAAGASDDADKGDDDDDKKKLAMDISYEGFSIYGRVLCLVVKRRDGIGATNNRTGAGGPAPAVGGGSSSSSTSGKTGGQAMMENFIISTQVPAGADAP